MSMTDQNMTGQEQASVSAEGVTNLIILQPTPFCNINCSYCYLPERANRTTLTLDQIQVMFEKLVGFPTIEKRVTVVWHAGEPLVLGTDYYESAFTRIRACCPDNLKIDHAFQTNGMLINDKWCDLIKTWNIGVGVSIDGPRHINDAARKTRTGKGTFDKTVAGIRCLQKRDIPFYVISVLGKNALAEPDAIFSLYRDLDIRDVGFNIEEQEGIHTDSSLKHELGNDSLNKFLTRFSELMNKHDFPIVVRELEEALASIRYFDKKGPINNLVIPFGIITIDVRGEVYTFSPEIAGYSSKDFETFSIGNIFTNSFDELKNSNVLKSMSAQINEGIELCRAQCGYFPVCGGGAPSNKVFENGTFASTTTMHCELTKKRVTDFLLSKIETMA
jgi:uncharacterized protein